MKKILITLAVAFLLTPFLALANPLPMEGLPRSNSQKSSTQQTQPQSDATVQKDVARNAIWFGILPLVLILGIYLIIKKRRG